MKQSKYSSKEPDKNGFVSYTAEENNVWHDLYTRQIDNIQDRACQEYIDGISSIGLTAQAIPQIPEVNEHLRSYTAWEVYPVPALIGFEKFFQLLANKKFPAATFIRTREEMDYLQEPDIFHEIFGHCPLLSNQNYADFMLEYGKLGLTVDHKTRVMLARLYWFTIEFGLIQKPEGLRIFGGGILSSFGETQYCLENDKPIRKALDPLYVFRTPYRIDIYQSIYFIINSFEELFNIMQKDLLSLIKEAQNLGMHEPLFEKKI